MVIGYMEELFEGDELYVLAFTYSWNQNVIGQISKLCKAMRVFTPMLKRQSQKVRGATVTKSGGNHWKGLVAWSDRLTMYCEGSSNLTHDIGGNYGTIFYRRGRIHGFDTTISVDNYKAFHEPPYVNLCENVGKETVGKCERCKIPVDVLHMNDAGMLVCERCLL